MYEAIIDAILRDDLSDFESQYLELAQAYGGFRLSSHFDLFMFDHNGFYNLLLLKRTEMINYLYRLNFQLMKCLVYMNLSRIEETELEEFWSYILDNGWHLKLNGEIDKFVFLNIVSKHFSLLELSVQKGVHLTQFEEIGGSLYIRVMTLFYNKPPEVIRKMLDDPIWRAELFSVDHVKALCLLITDGYHQGDHLRGSQRDQGDFITNIPSIILNKKSEIEECKDITLELTQIPRDVILYCIHPYF